MDLLNLPPEILHIIAKEAIADKECKLVFENLFLSCKRLRDVYQPLLLKYQLVRNYREFGYRRRVRSTNGWPIRTPWQLLYEITLQPQIANIIEFADLRVDANEQDDDGTQETHDESAAGYEKVDMDTAISSMLKQSPYLTSPEHNWKQWLDKMKAHEHEWRDPNHYNFDSDSLWGNIFLLSLLRHVQDIVVEGGYVHVEETDDRPLNKLLKQLVQGSSEDGAPLSRLREVLPTASYGYDFRYALEDYQYLLALPSLEAATLGCCIAMDDGYTGKPLRLNIDVFPNLKELDLWDCIIGADELYELVSRMPQLEIFKLNEGVKWHGCGYSTFDPAGIVRSLARAVGHQLRGLSLTTASDLGGCETTIGDFLALEQLEELEFSCDLVDTPYFDISRCCSRKLRKIRVMGETAFSGAYAQNYFRKLFDGFQARFPAGLPKIEIIEAICPVTHMPGAEKKQWDSFLAAIKPYKKVTPLKEAGFQFMQLTNQWPHWFQPDSD